MTRWRSGVLLLACLGGIRVYGSISLVTLPSALGSNDSVTWSQLGSDQATIPTNFSATSVHSQAITGSFATDTGQVAVVCPASPSCSWTTSGVGMSGGDSLIWTIDPNANPGNDGPLTLRFPSAFGAGAWIQADETDVIGSFTAQIQAFNGATSLGNFTEASDSNGDPIFIGVLSNTTAQISSVVFSLTVVPADASVNDFGLDTLFLKSTAFSVPEPGSVFLVGACLAGLVRKRRLLR